MKYRENPVFTRNKDLLKFYLDSYLGGDNYVTPNHLHQFCRETPTKFKERLARAYYLNYVWTVVRIYTQYVCGGVARLAEGDWKDQFEKKFYPDVTGDGVDLDSFFREGCDKNSVFGYQGVLIDGTKLIKNRPEIATKAADEANPPVLRKVDATDIVDWSVDTRGTLNWVLIKTIITEDSNPMVDRKSWNGLELWTRTGVWYYREKDKTGEETLSYQLGNEVVYEQVGSQIAYDYGKKVPFVWMRNSRTLLDGIPASMIKDIAQINKAIFNYTSLRDNIFYHQTFSILAVPTTSGDSEGDYEVVIGDNNYLEFDGTVNQAPLFLTAPSGPAEALTKAIREGVEEIWRLAVLEKSGNDKNSEYSTAYGRMVDSQDTESALVEKAELMESSELEVAVLYNRVRGVTSGEPFWKPTYPKTFDVRALAQDLADAIQEDTVGMGEEYMIERKKKIARKSFPELESKDMDKIDKGIEKATKLMEELKDPEISGGVNNANMGTTDSTNSLNAVGDSEKRKSSTTGS